MKQWWPLIVKTSDGCTYYFGWAGREGWRSVRRKGPEGPLEFNRVRLDQIHHRILINGILWFFVAGGVGWFQTYPVIRARRRGLPWFLGTLDLTTGRVPKTWREHH